MSYQQVIKYLIQVVKDIHRTDPNLFNELARFCLTPTEVVPIEAEGRGLACRVITPEIIGTQYWDVLCDQYRLFQRKENGDGIVFTHWAIPRVVNQVAIEEA